MGWPEVCLIQTVATPTNLDKMLSIVRGFGESCFSCRDLVQTLLLPQVCSRSYPGLSEQKGQDTDMSLNE